jgi:hypothetical protein
MQAAIMEGDASYWLCVVRPILKKDISNDGVRGSFCGQKRTRRLRRRQESNRRFRERV